MLLGKVVKSNSHCDYVAQLDDLMAVPNPPQADDFGFGSFVKLEDRDRHWAVGLIYNSLLVNPFLGNGPRLSSEPDPLFTPDLINETRTLLGIVLIGWMQESANIAVGIHGIPRVVVPVNTPVSTMSQDEIYRFHLNAAERPQFSYYSHLLRCGGSFAPQLAQQVLRELLDLHLFADADQRALEILWRELTWKSLMSAMN